MASVGLQRFEMSLARRHNHPQQLLDEAINLSRGGAFRRPESAARPFGKFQASAGVDHLWRRSSPRRLVQIFIRAHPADAVPRRPLTRLLAESVLAARGKRLKKISNPWKI